MILTIDIESGLTTTWGEPSAGDLQKTLLIIQDLFNDFEGSEIDLKNTDTETMNTFLDMLHATKKFTNDPVFKKTKLKDIDKP